MVDGQQAGRARYANHPSLKRVRRDLRNHATTAERALWHALQGRRLMGRKFRRQHSPGRHVVDFYCPAERLAIELDGAAHDDPLRHEHDARRQREIESLGIRVLRFRNEEVLDTLDLVAAAIALHFE